MKCQNGHDTIRQYRYYDGDLYCTLCGEPWDSYGVDHGDMTKKEAKEFKAGKGCPCCMGKGER